MADEVFSDKSTGHSPMLCPTCWTNLLLRGESVYNTKTGEHPDPADLVRFTPTKAMLAIAQQSLVFGRLIQEGLQALMPAPVDRP